VSEPLNKEDDDRMGLYDQKEDEGVDRNTKEGRNDGLGLFDTYSQLDPYSPKNKDDKSANEDAKFLNESEEEEKVSQIKEKSLSSFPKRLQQNIDSGEKQKRKASMAVKRPDPIREKSKKLIFQKDESDQNSSFDESKNAGGGIGAFESQTSKAHLRDASPDFLKQVDENSSQQNMDNGEDSESYLGVGSMKSNNLFSTTKKKSHFNSSDNDNDKVMNSGLRKYNEESKASEDIYNSNYQQNNLHESSDSEAEDKEYAFMKKGQLQSDEE